MTRPQIADVLLRTTEARRVPGNRVLVLRDAAENYRAWQAAAEAARTSIHLEMYILHGDRVGRRARDLLVAKAREGVTVRVLYDWVGSERWIPFSWGFWRPLRQAGGEVRAANPPALNSLLWLASRDHRKLLAVDGEVAFISGLCIADEWLGDADAGAAPWRDTGVELRGPAVADAEAAFASAWALWGPAIPRDELPLRAALAPAGSAAVRVVPTSPETAALYRAELAVATLARERFWVTDAYFMATTPYVQALGTAARSGVDVRVLVPGESDVRWIAAYSRSLYRPLLEAGVRVFEWDGPMLHAKTAVVDGWWTRVGSSNLNLSSWVRNWELDLMVEDAGVGGAMEELFLEDLENATEIVDASGRPAPAGPAPTPGRPPTAGRRGRRRRTVQRAVARARAVRPILGKVVQRRRDLDTVEGRSVTVFAALLVLLAGVLVWFPRVLAYPLAAVLLWEGAALALGTWRTRRGRGRGQGPGR